MYYVELERCCQTTRVYDANPPEKNWTRRALHFKVNQGHPELILLPMTSCQVTKGTSCTVSVAI